MATFEFRQNNSFGRWRGPKIIHVIADSADQANAIAVESGEVYFDGVRNGRDCPCCGSRWYRVQDWQANDLIYTPDLTISLNVPELGA